MFKTRGFNGVLIGLIFIFAVLIMSAFPADVFARGDWETAYRELLKDFIGEPVSITLVDMNNDGIPELIIVDQSVQWFHNVFHGHGRGVRFFSFDGTRTVEFSKAYLDVLDRYAGSYRADRIPGYWVTTFLGSLDNSGAYISYMLWETHVSETIFIKMNLMPDFSLNAHVYAFENMDMGNLDGLLFSPAPPGHSMEYAQHPGLVEFSEIISSANWPRTEEEARRLWVQYIGNTMLTQEDINTNFDWWKNRNAAAVSQPVTEPPVQTYHPPADINPGDMGIHLIYNGYYIEFASPPAERNGFMFFPLEQLLRALTGSHRFSLDTGTVSGVLDGNTVSVPLNDLSYWVNGEKLEVPDYLAPFSENRRTYVYLDYIVEGLGLNMHWAGETRTVHIWQDTPEILPPDIVSIVQHGPLKAGSTAELTIETTNIPPGAVITYELLFYDYNIGLMPNDLTESQTVTSGDETLLIINACAAVTTGEYNFRIIINGEDFEVVQSFFLNVIGDESNMFAHSRDFSGDLTVTFDQPEAYLNYRDDTLFYNLPGYASVKTLFLDLTGNFSVNMRVFPAEQLEEGFVLRYTSDESEPTYQSPILPRGTSINRINYNATFNFRVFDINNNPVSEIYRFDIVIHRLYSGTLDIGSGRFNEKFIRGFTVRWLRWDLRNFPFVYWHRLEGGEVITRMIIGRTACGDVWGTGLGDSDRLSQMRAISYVYRLTNNPPRIEDYSGGLGYAEDYYDWHLEEIHARLNSASNLRRWGNINPYLKGSEFDLTVPYLRICLAEWRNTTHIAGYIEGRMVWDHEGTHFHADNSYLSFLGATAITIPIVGGVANQLMFEGMFDLSYGERISIIPRGTMFIQSMGTNAIIYSPPTPKFAEVGLSFVSNITGTWNVAEGRYTLFLTSTLNADLITFNVLPMLSIPIINTPLSGSAILGYAR